MTDPAGKALTKLESQRRPEAQAASGFPPVARRPDSYVSVAASDLADEERVRLALDRTEKAARLLEAAFLFAIGENELLTPAVEQHYAALQQAEASAVALEAQLLRSHRRGEPGENRQARRASEAPVASPSEETP